MRVGWRYVVRGRRWVMVSIPNVTGSKTHWVCVPRYLHPKDVDEWDGAGAKPEQPNYRSTMRTTFLAAAAGLLLTLTASAAPAVAAPEPLRIVGTPKLTYWEYGNPKGKSKGVVYQFQTNRPLRKGWKLRLSGMSVVNVSRGGRGTCYNGEFGVGEYNMPGIHRLLRPGKLVTLEVREPQPPRKAHRGVRAQRFPGSREAGGAAALGCRE